MVDLKRAGKAEGSLLTAEPAEEEYPYGLRICLDGETLDALGWKTMPKVGTKVSFTATAIVQSINVHADAKYEDGDVERTVDLQITGMDIINAPKAASEMLYGGS